MATTLNLDDRFKLSGSSKSFSVADLNRLIAQRDTSVVTYTDRLHPLGSSETFSIQDIINQIYGLNTVDPGAVVHCDGQAKQVTIQDIINELKFQNNTGGGATANNGFDPQLGPPYPPVNYQLFCHATSPRLTWTNPIVGGPGAIKFNNQTAVNAFVRFKTTNSFNNGDTATQVVPNASVDLSQPANVLFVLVTTSASIAPGTPGVAVPQSPFPPQYIVWTGAGTGGNGGFPANSGLSGSLWYISVNSISSFSLYRRTDPNFAGTMSGGGANYGTYNPNGDVLFASPGASALSFDDTTAPNTRFYYRLVGHTTNFDFLQNDVYIVLAPVLAVDSNGASWTGADTTADHFILNQSPDGGVTWTAIATIPGTGATSYSYPNTGLNVAGMSYQVVEYLPVPGVPGSFTQVPSNTLTIQNTVPSGTLLWVKTLAGSTSVDKAQVNAVARDSAGNSYATGQFQGVINLGDGVSRTSKGVNDIFIIKYDPAGNVVSSSNWPKVIGGDSDDLGLGVSIDANGNPVFCGYITTTSLAPQIDFGGGNKLPTVAAFQGQIGFVVKYDPNGNFLSGATFGVSATFKTWIQSVDVDTSNNTILGGYFDSGPINFGGGNLTGTGYTVFIAKLSPSFAWVPGTSHQHSWGGSGQSNFQQLVVDKNNDIWAGGYYAGNNNFGGGFFNSGGNAAGWVGKYNGSDGNPQWAKAYVATGTAPPNLVAAVYGVAADPITGNLSSVGYFANTTDFGSGSVSSHGVSNCIFITCYDTSGNMQTGFPVHYEGIGNPPPQNVQDIGHAAGFSSAGIMLITQLQSSLNFNGTFYFGNGGIGFAPIGINNAGVTNPGAFRWLHRSDTGSGQGLCCSKDGGTMGGQIQGTNNFGNGPISLPIGTLGGFVARYAT